MKPGRLTKRILVLVFAIWFGFQPLAVEVFAAEDDLLDAAGPKQGDQVVDSSTNPDDILMPNKWLEFQLMVYGNTREALEHMAFGQAQQMIIESLNLMGVDSSDAVGVHQAIAKHLENRNKNTVQQNLGPAFQELSPYFTGFFNQGGGGTMAAKANAFLAEHFPKIQKFLEESGFGEAMLSSPEGGSCTWLLKTRGLLEAGKVGLKFLGIATTVVGLIGTVDSLLHSEDLKGGVRGIGGGYTWDTIKLWIDYTMGIVNLMLLTGILVFPPAALILLGVIVTELVLDQIGRDRAKWLECYENSFWFLKTEDEKFRTFFENQDVFKANGGKRSLSWIRADEDFGARLEEQKKIDCNDRNVKNYEGVYKALVRQGVLMTYYGTKDIPLDSVSRESLLELWRAKTDYMSWKPTEAEAKEGKSFLDKIWSALATFATRGGYLAPVLKKATDDRFKKFLAQYDREYVYFNPDFALTRIFMNFRQSKPLDWQNSSVAEVLALRLEQAPFNYLPLLSISTDRWSDAVLRKAFTADAVLARTKELSGLVELLKKCNDRLEYRAKNTEVDREKRFDNSLDKIRLCRSAISMLARAPETVKNDLLKKDLQKLCQVLEERDILTNEDYGRFAHQKSVPKSEIVAACREKLEKTFIDQVGTLSMTPVNLYCRLLQMSLGCCVAQLLEQFANQEETWAVWLESDSRPEMKEIRDFMVDGKCLDIQGRNGVEEAWNGFANFLGGIETPLKDFRHYLVRFRQEAKRYHQWNRIFTTTGDRSMWLVLGAVGFLAKLTERTTSAPEIKKIIDEYYYELGSWKELAEQCSRELPDVKLLFEASSEIYEPAKVPWELIDLDRKVQKYYPDFEIDPSLF